MENHKKRQKPPIPDSISDPERRNSGDHISFSPPVGSPENSPPESYSSPLHFELNGGGHISISPPEDSPGNSPARSSVSSDHIIINPSRGPSPEIKKLSFPENKSPPVVVERDVYEEPVEVVNRVVLVEAIAVASRSVLDEPKAVVAKTDFRRAVEGGGGGVGGGQRRVRPQLSILRRAKREKMVKKTALGFRVFGFLFCLISFSVMASDRNQGWAVDSFDRYVEFRYCLSINVIGFIYSGAQALDLSYNLATGKYIVQQQQQLRHYFDFAVDQIIAYLLISASSSATTRVDDWQSNWGKDKFPDMATASVLMSFLAFVALAANALISGYALCTSKSV